VTEETVPASGPGDDDALRRAYGAWRAEKLGTVVPAPPAILDG